MDVKMQDKRKPGKFTAWKQVIIGEGDWLDADGSLLKPRYSCEQGVHLVLNQAGLRPNLYHHCGRYMGIHRRVAEYGKRSFDRQPGGPTPCVYQLGGKLNRAGFGGGSNS